MARQKNDGRGRLGGRQKGSLNKTTSDLKEWVANILDSGRDEFYRRLASLDDRDYIRTYTGLLSYVLPKMSPTTPEEMFRKEREMMQELLLSMPFQIIDKIANRLYELQIKENNENQIEQH